METKDEVTIVLAKKKIKVQPLPVFDDAGWRVEVERFSEHLAGQAEHLDFSDNAALIRSLLTMPKAVFEAVDAMFALMLEYPEIKEHEEHIRKNCRSYEEVIRAFFEVVSLSIPLDRLWETGTEVWRQVNALASANGSQVVGTGKNSRSPNGGTAQESLTTTPDTASSSPT